MIYCQNIPTIFKTTRWAVYEQRGVDYMDENVVRRPWISRIPYLRGIEQINIVDNIDPQDSEKTIERMGKGCAHSALKLDFSLS